MTKPDNDRREKLLEALRSLTPVMRRRLAQLKEQASQDRKRPDLIWYLLLASAATLGDAAAFSRLFGEQQLVESVSYASLVRLNSDARQRRLLAALQAAAVRYAPKKSKQLAENLITLERRGGVELETKRALSLVGDEAKRDYLLFFKGIGPKYANNIWMDIYDADFRDCVAVDVRITNVMHELGIGDELDPQAYFRNLAREANLETWEVDRLLFWFTDYFIAAIRW
jgi:endonuclease III